MSFKHRAHWLDADRDERETTSSGKDWGRNDKGERVDNREAESIHRRLAPTKGVLSKIHAVPLFTDVRYRTYYDALAVSGEAGQTEIRERLAHEGAGVRMAVVVLPPHVEPPPLDEPIDVSGLGEKPFRITIQETDLKRGARSARTGTVLYRVVSDVTTNAKAVSPSSSSSLSLPPIGAGLGAKASLPRAPPGTGAKVYIAAEEKKRTPGTRAPPSSPATPAPLGGSAVVMASDWLLHHDTGDAKLAWDAHQASRYLTTPCGGPLWGTPCGTTTTVTTVSPLSSLIAL